MSTRKQQLTKSKVGDEKYASPSYHSTTAGPDLKSLPKPTTQLTQQPKKQQPNTNQLVIKSILKRDQLNSTVEEEKHGSSESDNRLLGILTRKQLQLSKETEQKKGGKKEEQKGKKEKQKEQKEQKEEKNNKSCVDKNCLQVESHLRSLLRLPS